MQPRHTALENRVRALHAGVPALAALLLALSASAAPVTLPARELHYRPRQTAWARVEPIAPLVLRTALAARIIAVRVLPGEAVRAGQAIVTLGGPRLDAALAEARAGLRAAQAELAAARRNETSVARTYPAITNRQTLAAAQSALAAAQSHWAQAQATATQLRAETHLRSPAAAVVGRIEAAPGTDLPAGAAVLSLLPHGRLWLRAEWFGGGALPALGESAHFEVSGGTLQIPVRLQGALPARAANGARVLDFAPLGAPSWQAGEVGEVRLDGAPRAALAVPAAALVLQAGRWFVLTDVNGKLRAQAVTPGPTRGGEVLILAGLKVGVPVVVRQAYLLYHRDIADRYTSPD